LNNEKAVGDNDELVVEDGLMGDNGLEDMLEDCEGIDIRLTVKGFVKGSTSSSGMRDVTFDVGCKDDAEELGLGEDFNVM
jgi:hypothetical protein